MPRNNRLVTPAQNISILELSTIGIGPSRSHTVGPMRAAARFVRRLAGSGTLPPPARTCAANTRKPPAVDLR